jgi:FMN reductase (NADPH)
MTTSVTTSVIEQIHHHASVRAYTTEPVAREMIKEIVSAGQRAATSSNLQAYSVIAVTEPERKAAIAHLCGDQRHIIDAPVFLAWCADLSKLDRAAQLRDLPHSHEYVESFLVAAIDVTLAAQTAALAAESLGLGICYIGGIRNAPRQIIQLLHLPKLMFPITGMTIGWPRRTASQRPRLPLDTVLQWEHFSSEGMDAALYEYDKSMAATGIYNHRQVPVPGKPGQMDEYGWLEHCARRVSQPIRVELREILKEQGFELQ